MAAIRNMNDTFDPDCRRCPRLASFLDEVKSKYPTYHCRPVAPFGAANPSILIVGLAPGLHGANRTGRPFTGDYAGILLYETLHKFSLATRPVSVSADDGLRLMGARITNAVKCLPPANKPEPAEITACNAYLNAELATYNSGLVILALGLVAHSAVLKAFKLRAAGYKFAHAAEHSLSGGKVLVDSYHCSRYNTQTRRLTTAMFEAVIGRAVELSKR